MFSQYENASYDSEVMSILGYLSTQDSYHCTIYCAHSKKTADFYTVGVFGSSSGGCRHGATSPN